MRFCADYYKREARGEPNTFIADDGNAYAMCDLPVNAAIRYCKAGSLLPIPSPNYPPITSLATLGTLVSDLDIYNCTIKDKPMANKTITVPAPGSTVYYASGDVVLSAEVKRVELDAGYEHVKTLAGQTFVLGKVHSDRYRAENDVKVAIQSKIANLEKEIATLRTRL